jgi:hypothetical protein
MDYASSGVCFTFFEYMESNYDFVLGFLGVMGYNGL